jgi:large subunit ribosomal protein L13
MRRAGSTWVAKRGEVQPRWLLVDAEGRVLGRMATRLATILQGKHRPTYTPHVDTGDFVVVVNAARVRVTGRKEKAKIYQKYTGWLSGRKEMTFEELRAKRPERIIELAVRRMLPKTRLGRAMLKKLKVYPGPEHPHAAQQPSPIEL